MPPQRIEDYAVERLLGRGSFGEVHLARDATGGQVAIKLLLADSARDADARKRFEREARSAMRVRHPNVVAALATGAFEDRPYLVCEFAPGGSLLDLLRREGRLPAERALRLASDIFRGLVAIHGAGLVHRDLKPANVLLAADGRAQIADLGLTRPVAMQRTVLTQQGMILGTPAYVAPEQIEHGESVDGRADLYSAGIVLYQMLTGTLPFAFTDPFDLLRAHVGVAPPDPARRAPVAPEVSKFVLRLLAKKPGGRPRDAAEALAECGALRGEPDGTLALTLPDADTAVSPAASAGPPRTIPDAPTDAADHASDPTIARGATASAALRLRDETGGILFLFAADEVAFGRDATGGDPRRACLRVLSGADAAGRSLRMSGRHFALKRAGTRWAAHDLGSSNGTSVGGERLAPGMARELAEGDLISVAGVVELRARLVPSGPGATPATAPSLLLERQGDGAHHRYLLVASPVALDLGTRPVAVGAGPWIVSSEREALWLRSGADVVPADRLAAGALRAMPIQPDDAKH